MRKSAVAHVVQYGATVRSFTTSLVLAAFAVTSGCSSKSESAADPAAAQGAAPGTGAPIAVAASGTRLKAKVLSGAGVTDLAGWHDSLRNEDCTFQPAETGHIRCLPETLTAFQNGTFSDPACLVPTASAPATTCSAGVKYAISYRSDPNCGTQIAAELRKALDPKGNRYGLSGAGGACALLTTAPPAGQPATVPLGDVVPWTAFVEATETNVAGDPLTERVLVATDGARQHVGFRDDKRGADCSFQLISDGSLRCVPEATSGPVLYGDSSCTRPLLVNNYQAQGGPGGPGGCGTKTPSNDMWLEPPTETCGGLRAVYSLKDYSSPAAGDGYDVFGWQVTSTGGPSTSATTTTKCTSEGMLSSGDTTNRRAIDANITAALPGATRVGSGSGRLVPALVWPPGQGTTLVPGWHDTEKDVDCTFTLASDGKMRCLPTAAMATLFHTDDKCKSPAIVAVQAEPECLGKASFARTVSTTCPPTTTIYALGPDAHNLPSASFSSTPGACAKVGGANAAHDATLVDPTQFVEGVPSTQ